MPATLRIIFGIIFLLLGVIGSLLPVLQGWMFFLLAAVMLFPKHPRVEKILVRTEARMPRVTRWIRSMGVGRDPGSLD